MKQALIRNKQIDKIMIKIKNKKRENKPQQRK